MSAYDRLYERYTLGQVPWDHELPPPEVIQQVAQMPLGRALDLGCGYGRAAIYLARHGWQVDGIDFVDLALVEARQRAAAAQVETQAQFFLSPVTDMPSLTGPYDLALDVGCMHNFDEKQLLAYGRELHRLVRPGGLYLLFAHLRSDPPEYDADDRPRWMPLALIQATFAPGFLLERVEHGSTQVGDQAPWPSAWFWFRRRPAAE